MSWRVKLWCGSCVGEDPMGCFEGGSEVQDERYATRAEAEAAGEEKTKDCGPWVFDVFEDTSEADQPSNPTGLTEPKT